jgi:hypothetical protein
MQKAKRISLGEGEGRDATGQMKKHILESKKEMEYQENSTSIDFFLKDLGVLTHDEHAKMVFEAGSYRSYNQVEFNPFDETVNRVFD